MAGTVTQSLERIGSNGPCVWTLNWTADASNGSVPATAMESAYVAEIQGLRAELAVTNPGSTAPTDNYDITVTDADGADIFGGALADRDTLVSEQAMPLIGAAYGPRLVVKGLTFNLTNNSVNSATGTLKVIFAR